MNAFCEVTWIYNQVANNTAFSSIVFVFVYLVHAKCFIDFTFLSNLRDLILHNHFGNEVAKQNRVIYNSFPAHEFL